MVQIVYHGPVVTITFNKADLVKILLFVSGGGLAGTATALSSAFPNEGDKILAYSGIVALVAGALLHVVAPSTPASTNQEKQ